VDGACDGIMWDPHATSAGPDSDKMCKAYAQLCQGLRVSAAPLSLQLVPTTTSGG
jgi:hypothetical protein